jgi:hypothetical protein
MTSQAVVNFHTTDRLGCEPSVTKGELSRTCMFSSGQLTRFALLPHVQGRALGQVFQSKHSLQSSDVHALDMLNGCFS